MLRSDYFKYVVPPEEDGGMIGWRTLRWTFQVRLIRHVQSPDDDLDLGRSTMVSLTYCCNID